MQPLNITITDLALDTVIGAGYGDEPITLADAIVSAAVEALAKEGDYREIHTGLRDRVRAIRDEEIRARVQVEVEAELNKPFQATNQYGEARGEPLTLRTLIAKKVEDFFTANISEYNKPRTTLAVRFIDTAVEKALKDELAAAIVDEKAKVVAAVRAKAADLIAAAVREGVGR